MPVISVAQYGPDQPAQPGNPAFSARISNVLPRTANSYAPFPSLSTFSTGTNPIARVQGAYTCQDTSGNVNIFAGDATKLYQLVAGATTFSDVSKVAGYSTATDQRWACTLFGSRIIATNFTDAPQSFVMGTSSVFADMITSGFTSLKARYVGVVKDWVVFGNTTDGTYGAQPQRVWWSAIDDPTNFPDPTGNTAAAVQSDYQDLVGDAGWVQGIVGNLGTADGAIFQERAVVRMVYVGPPAIFAFAPAEGVRGTPAPGSIVQDGPQAYYLGEDGFYVFNGSSSQPIGVDRVDKEFLGDLDQSYFHRISGAVDPINKQIWWAYPGSGHSGGNPNRIIVYDRARDRWTITDANDVQCEILLRGLTPGYNIDTLDALYGNLDSVPVSLDSRLLTGGRPFMAAFNTSHQLANFSGSALAPTVETAEGELAGPGRRALITNVRPLVDGGTASVSIGTRNLVTESVTYSSPVAVDSRGNCPQRVSARYMRARLTLPAGSSFTHISGLGAPGEGMVPQGRR
jgi:hypothetical protein